MVCLTNFINELSGRCLSPAHFVFSFFKATVRKGYDTPQQTLSSVCLRFLLQLTHYRIKTLIAIKDLMKLTIIDITEQVII